MNILLEFYTFSAVKKLFSHGCIKMKSLKNKLKQNSAPLFCSQLTSNDEIYFLLRKKNTIVLEL